MCITQLGLLINLSLIKTKYLQERIIRQERIMYGNDGQRPYIMHYHTLCAPGLHKTSQLRKIIITIIIELTVVIIVCRYIHDFVCVY